jgi:winged helix-turn-helix
MLWLLNLSDGDADLLDIALRAGLPFGVIREAADAPISAGLLADFEGLKLDIVRRIPVSLTEIVGASRDRETNHGFPAKAVYFGLFTRNRHRRCLPSAC